MKLRQGEHVIKIFRHHPTPFVIDVFKIIVAFLPFFFVLFAFQEMFSAVGFLIANLVLFFVFTLVVVYLGFVYWLDRLVITNIRVVHIDWKYLTVRDEAEGFLKDIEDIQTQENGVLANLKIFDYGTIKIDTASSHQTLAFTQAPDPEGIRQYIYHIRQQ